MHLTDNLWIYVVVVIYSYVMWHLLQGKTSNTTHQTVMSQKPKIKTIKCRVCYKKFKVKSTDFEKEMQTCVLADCDLKGRLEEINSVVLIPCKLVKVDSIVVTIEDPIVIRVNKHGIQS